MRPRCSTGKNPMQPHCIFNWVKQDISQQNELTDFGS